MVLIERTQVGETSPRVLIVGAGPVGLALAIELGHQSIPCLLIERNERVGFAPRAKTTNIRSRELMRRWGIAETLKKASPFGADYPSNVVFVTKLAGHEITRFENALFCGPGRNPLYSEHSQWIPQYTVEEVMREHAQSLPGVEIRFSSKLKRFDQTESAVMATICDLKTGRESEIEIDYLVGTDGARSAVREAIGGQMQGQHGLSRNYNIVFKAPGLAQAHPHGPAIMYWQVGSDTPSMIGPMDRGDKWFFMPTKVPDHLKPNLETAAALITQATGINMPYEVLSVDEWTASSLISDRYRAGRVFLAGDACHLHPPFGGYGMNMGIADGVDLGWKLACVLKGQGASALLDSYEIERRQVHEYVLAEAVANHATHGTQLRSDTINEASASGDSAREALARQIQATKIREFTGLGVVLGIHYENSPVIVADGTSAPEPDFLNYVPSSRPGHLAPHAWLHDGSSLYDHFGLGFCLLVRRDLAQEEVAAAVRTSDNRCKVIQPKEAAIASLYPAKFTLIRPDQHVAWRGDEWAAVGEKVFDQALGGSLLAGKRFRLL